jgi:hypothetical protein
MDRFLQKSGRHINSDAHTHRYYYANAVTQRFTHFDSDSYANFNPKAYLDSNCYANFVSDSCAHTFAGDFVV